MRKQVWGIKDEYFEKVYPNQEKKMTKYLFDLIAYRYFDGKRIETKRETIQIDANDGKGMAMSRAIACFVEPSIPEQFIDVDIKTVRVGDASR